MINKDNSITSKIVISCSREGKKTLLKDSLFDIPYKVVHYGSKLLQDHLEVMLMCYSPGTMDGDVVDIEVNCTKHSEMKLFTQSYNKLHPMKTGAIQRQKITVGKEAQFQFLPHPVIPFEKSIFNAVNEIHLDESAHLIWSDILSAGRVHSGEKFKFTHYHTQTKIFRSGSLLFYDNQLLAPSKQKLNNLLFFEGFTHQGTILIASPLANAFKKELDKILLEQATDMSYGYTICAEHAIIIRILGNSGEDIYEWISNIGQMCWEYIEFHKPRYIAPKTETPIKKTTKAPKRKTA